MRAVLFDWGGTLTPWHTVELAEAWRACGLGDEAADRLVAAEHEVWRRARETQRSGTIDEVFAAAGVTAGPAELAAYYAWWEQHTYTDPDVPAAARRRCASAASGSACCPTRCGRVPSTSGSSAATGWPS